MLTLKVQLNFNFCEEFIQHVATCLYHFRSRTLVNCFLSSFIKLLRGCRQGDPVAAYLFILSLEILLRKINSEGLEAWELKKGVKQLLEGYADDLTIVLKLIGNKQDKVQLKKVIEILQKFKEISGLSINLKKTNIVPFGKFLEPHIMNLSDHTRLKRADNFRLLGIDFNNKLL